MRPQSTGGASETAATHRALAAAHARLAARDDAIVRSQIAVAQIAAPTGEEHERGSWVTRRFLDSGLADIHTDAAGNVIGRRAGTTRLSPVVICAHLDTVFPRTTDLSIRRDGERLVGPGINDNGRGLAVMLALLAVAGVGSGYQVIAAAAFLQRLPDSGRGAAFGFAASGVLAVQGLGFLAGGAAAQAIGPQAVVAIAGAAGFGAAAILTVAWARVRTDRLPGQHGQPGQSGYQAEGSNGPAR